MLVPSIYFQLLWGPAIHSSTARKAVSTQMETGKSFIGHIFPPNFGFVMDIASMLTLKIMLSYTNCLTMRFHWEAQKSLQARWILWPQLADQIFRDSSSLLVLPGSPTALPKPLCLGALPGGQDLSAQPQHFPVGSLGEVARTELFPGQVVPPAHAESHPNTGTWTLHHLPLHSHHPLLRQGLGPWLAGTCSEATSALVSSMQG